jgi:WD40 repeat protein
MIGSVSAGGSSPVGEGAPSCSSSRSGLELPARCTRIIQAGKRTSAPNAAVAASVASRGRSEGPTRLASADGDHLTRLEQRRPDAGEDAFEARKTVCVAFDPAGLLLALGCNDGCIQVWDVESWSVAVEIAGHVRCLRTIEWLCGGKVLATASIDGTCHLWDLEGLVHAWSMTFSAPLRHLAVSPLSPSAGQDRQLLLAIPAAGVPMVYFVSTGDSGTSVVPTQVPLPDNILRRARFAATASSSSALVEVITTGVILGTDSSVIVLGTNAGRLLSVEASQCRTFAAGHDGEEAFPPVASDAPPSGMTASGVFVGGGFVALCRGERVLDRAGPLFALFANRSLGLIRADTLTEITRIQDPSESVPLSVVAPSGDGSLVLGGRAKVLDSCLAYIWDQAGNLRATLSMQSDNVMGLAWHPHRGVVVTVDKRGRVLVWEPKHSEGWTKFSPIVSELHSNVRGSSSLSSDISRPRDTEAHLPETVDLVSRPTTASLVRPPLLRFHSIPPTQPPGVVPLVSCGGLPSLPLAVSLPPPATLPDEAPDSRSLVERAVAQVTAVSQRHQGLESSLAMKFGIVGMKS